MSLWSLHVFEGFLSSLDFIDYSKLAVIADTPFADLLIDPLVNEGYAIIKTKEEDRERSVKFVKPNTYLVLGSSRLPYRYTAWVSFQDKVTDTVSDAESVFSSLLTDDVGELFLLLRAHTEDFFINYRILEKFRAFKGSTGRAEALILVENDLSLVDKFNLVTFLAKTLKERLVNRVSVLRIDRLRKYFYSDVLEDLVRWALRLYSENIGRDIILADTRETRHVYFISLFSINDASLLIRNIAGASSLAKFLTWGAVFTGDLGYAYLEGNAELLNEVSITDMIKACGWTIHKVFIPKQSDTDYVRMFLAESSQELIGILASDIWRITEVLSGEERNLKTILPAVRLTREFLSEVERGSQ
ncbi:MAG: hypothetical protein QW705_01475 [Zestosphaera sp.]